MPDDPAQSESSDPAAPTQRIVADASPGTKLAEWVVMVGVGVAAHRAVSAVVPVPYDDDSSGYLLWFCAPLAIPPLLLLVARLAWGLVGVARAVATARLALGRDGRVTRTGTLRARGDAEAPIAWIRRSEERSSAARAFELRCDDGSSLIADGGPWAVFDPFGPHVAFGYADLREGDRVIVDAHLVEEAAPSDRGDYREIATRLRALGEGGSIAPEGFRYGRPPQVGDTRRGAFITATVIALALPFVRLEQEGRPTRTVSVGERCDTSHVCAPGSWCKSVEDGRRQLCVNECARDAECPPESRCETDLGRCSPSGAPPVVRHALESCASNPCAEGLLCFHGLSLAAPVQYCVRPCRRDADCDRGLWCVLATRRSNGHCDRVDNLPDHLQPLERAARDAGADDRALPWP